MKRKQALKLALSVLENDFKHSQLEKIFAAELIKSQEIIEKLKCGDQMGDLIQANRDQILKIKEEGLRRIEKALKENDAVKALKIIEVINFFHPMHEDSWKGWPDE